MALTEDGVVWAWGSTEKGQIDGDQNKAIKKYWQPIPVELPDKIISI